MGGTPTRLLAEEMDSGDDLEDAPSAIPLPPVHGGPEHDDGTDEKSKEGEINQKSDERPENVDTPEHDVLNEGDLVRISNRQRAGRVQGGLARIVTVHPESEGTDGPTYDIEYLLGGKHSGFDRDDLVYTTAEDEGLTDDGAGRRRRALVGKQEPSAADEPQDDAATKTKRASTTTTSKKGKDRKPGLTTSAAAKKRRKSGDTSEDDSQSKASRSDISKQGWEKRRANKSAKPTGKGGKSKASAKDAKAAKPAKRGTKRGSSDAVESDATPANDSSKEARKDLYGKHKKEMEKSILRLEKVDRFGFFLDTTPVEFDENYEVDEDSETGESDDGAMSRAWRPNGIEFPTGPPFDFHVLRKRFAAGRYDKDLVTPELERQRDIRAILAAQAKETDGTNGENGDANENADDGSPREAGDDLDLDTLARSMCHPVAVDWDLLKSDVDSMCDAAMARDPDGVNLGSGHLGFTARKVKKLMEEMYSTYGSKRLDEVITEEIRDKYGRILLNCGNSEAAMQGEWRKTAFSERKYARLETASVICDGLSPKDSSYAMHELETKLPDSFVGLAYTYDDAGQHSEMWMKTVANETTRTAKVKRKRPKKGEEGSDDTSTVSNKAAKAAMALATDDGVVRAQVQTTMTTLLIQVQDRVMTDLGVMNHPEARSANWDDGDRLRDYDTGAGSGEAMIQQGNLCKSAGGLPQVAEQEVWGIDCYTRKNVMCLIEREFNADIAVEFVQKWLLPAINACPVELAHRMSTAAKILEGLDPMTPTLAQSGGYGPNDDSRSSAASEDVKTAESAAKPSIEGAEVSFTNESVASSLEQIIATIEARSTETANQSLEDCSMDRPEEVTSGIEKATPLGETRSSDDVVMHDAVAADSALSQPISVAAEPVKESSSVFLRDALRSKIRQRGPPWLRAAARLVRLASDAVDDDFFRIHPKGHGSVVIGDGGLKANSLITYYRGEVYPAWRWCEKLDAIERVQKEKNLRPNLPDFYNMAMERPKKDPRGYCLLFVDASRKSGLGSSFSHSCNPTCEVRVVSLHGKLQLSMTTLRDLEQGEELTFDYNAVTESLDEYRFAVCLCGQRRCRGSFLHYATADCYQQVLSRNSPIAARFANLVRGCTKQVMSREDSAILARHGFNTAAFGAVSFNHHAAATSLVSRDSIDNVPIWLRTYVADCLRYIEYERRALPVALLCNQMERMSKDSKAAVAKRKSSAKKSNSETASSSSKPAKESKPKSSYFYYLEKKRSQFEAATKKKHGSLRGLELAQAVNKEVAKSWAEMSDGKKEVWKKKAVAEWKKGGGSNKDKGKPSKQETQKKNKEKGGMESQPLKVTTKAKAKKSETTALGDAASKEKESASKQQNELGMEAKTISFADADAEGSSAMEQRIQQLAQSLSRVGRVLDRHRESVLADRSIVSGSINSKMLRSLAPRPLKIMDDVDVVNWLWNDPGGVAPQLFANVRGAFPAKSLFLSLLDNTKSTFPVLAAFSNGYIPRLDRRGKHSCSAADARRIVKEALLMLRSNIVEFIEFAEEAYAEAKNEKKREQARVRKEKKDKEDQGKGQEQQDTQGRHVSLSSLADAVEMVEYASIGASGSPVENQSTVFSQFVAGGLSSSTEVDNPVPIRGGGEDNLPKEVAAGPAGPAELTGVVASAVTKDELETIEHPVSGVSSGSDSLSAVRRDNRPKIDALDAETDPTEIQSTQPNSASTRLADAAATPAVTVVPDANQTKPASTKEVVPTGPSPTSHNHFTQQTAVDNAGRNPQASSTIRPTETSNRHDKPSSLESRPQEDAQVAGISASEPLSSLLKPPHPMAPPPVARQATKVEPTSVTTPSLAGQVATAVAPPQHSAAPTSKLHLNVSSEDAMSLLELSRAPTSTTTTTSPPGGQISNQSCPNPSNVHQGTKILSPASKLDDLINAGEKLPDLTLTDTPPSGTKPKRKVVPLTEEQAKYLKDWIFHDDNILNPYPSDAEKAKMIADTGVDKKRLDQWLQKNRVRVLYPEVKSIKMKWKRTDQEHWNGWRKNRYMLEATADLLLMYACTTTFFTLQPFHQFDSTPIEVYAREIGNQVPAELAMEEKTMTKDARNEPPAVNADSDNVSAESTKVPKEEDETTLGKTRGSSKKLKKEEAAVKLCSPEAVIDKVTIDYCGEYVLSQLLQWVNGGMGQAKGLPDFYGCVALPPVSGCWENVTCLEVKRPNHSKLKVKTTTEYDAKQRPKIVEWIKDRYQRGSSMGDDLARFLCPGQSATPDPLMPMGSPVLDYLVTGVDGNILQIVNALTDGDDGRSASPGKCRRLSATDRLQNTVDEGMPAQAVANWVQCENPKCLKWRKLPWHVDVDLLPEKFFCKDNKWNPGKRSCESPEDDWDMDDAPVKFDTNDDNFEIGAWFDVQREKKVGYHEAQVVAVDLKSKVKRVKFHFYKLSSERDEWIDIGSPRIAPHHSYTPAPRSGYGKSKSACTNTATNTRVGNSIGHDDAWFGMTTASTNANTATNTATNAATNAATNTVLPQKRMAEGSVASSDQTDSAENPAKKRNYCPFPRETVTYLNKWINANAANPFPTPLQKEAISSETGLTKRQIGDWMARARKRLKRDTISAPGPRANTSITSTEATAHNLEKLILGLKGKGATASSAPSRPPQQSGGAIGPPRQNGDVMGPPPQKMGLVGPPQKKEGLMGPPPLKKGNTVISQQNEGVSNDRISYTHQQGAKAQGDCRATAPFASVISSSANPKSQTTSLPTPPKSTGLSDQAKAYLTKWLNEHKAHPYPSRQKKDEMCNLLRISDPFQLDGWLCRARKKLMQPASKSHVPKGVTKGPAAPVTSNRSSIITANSPQVAVARIAQQVRAQHPPQDKPVQVAPKNSAPPQSAGYRPSYPPGQHAHRPGIHASNRPSGYVSANGSSASYRPPPPQMNHLQRQSYGAQQQSHPSRPMGGVAQQAINRVTGHHVASRQPHAFVNRPSNQAIPHQSHPSRPVGGVQQQAIHRMSVHPSQLLSRQPQGTMIRPGAQARPGIHPQQRAMHPGGAVSQRVMQATSGASRPSSHQPSQKHVAAHTTSNAKEGFAVAKPNPVARAMVAPVAAARSVAVPAVSKGVDSKASTHPAVSARPQSMPSPVPPASASTHLPKAPEGSETRVSVPHSQIQMPNNEGKSDSKEENPSNALGGLGFATLLEAVARREKEGNEHT